MAEQYANHRIVRYTIGGAQRGMERRFSRVWQGLVDIRALLNQKLTEPPVPVKRRTIEVQIVTERLKRFTIRKQKPYRANVAVVRAPSDQRRTIAGD